MKKKLFLFAALLFAGLVSGAEKWHFDFAKDLPPKSTPAFPYGGLTRAADHIEIPSWGFTVDWGFAGVLDPDREYRMTIQGNGPCEVYITFGGAILEWRINLSGTYERVFRVPVYARKTGFLRISRPKGAKGKLVLRDIHFQAHLIDKLAGLFSGRFRHRLCLDQYFFKCCHHRIPPYRIVPTVYRILRRDA